MNEAEKIKYAIKKLKFGTNFPAKRQGHQPLAYGGPNEFPSTIERKPLRFRTCQELSCQNNDPLAIQGENSLVGEE